MGCHFLLQGIIPTQGLNLHLLHCRWILYCSATQGSYTLDLQNENPQGGALASVFFKIGPRSFLFAARLENHRSVFCPPSHRNQCTGLATFLPLFSSHRGPFWGMWCWSDLASLPAYLSCCFLFLYVIYLFICLGLNWTFTAA